MAVDDAGKCLSIHAEPLSGRAHARRAAMRHRFRPDSGVLDGRTRMLRIQPLPRILSRFDLVHEDLLSVVVVLVADGPHVLAVQAEGHAPAMRFPDAPISRPLAVQAVQAIHRQRERSERFRPV